MPDQLDSAYLRSRAEHYREMAEAQTDSQMAAVFRELAASFDREAITQDGISLIADAN